jgi:hypothetical protein
MSILNPEQRALLKRMDADDAINKAVHLALEAAAKCAEAEICECCWTSEAQAAADHIAESIRALQTKE